MFSTPSSCSAVAFLAFSVHWTHALVVHDVSSSTPSALAAEASIISTSDTPFFTSISTGQSDGGQQSEDGSQGDATQVSYLFWL
ncbi:hypothetical protein ACEPAF_9026 [Sanghuangporus sanghuang]